MFSSIFADLYFGKIIPWERHASDTPERSALNRKIENEKRYFIEKMSLDDCKRFQDLENLYTQSTTIEEVDIFTDGFTLGALIMMEVMESRRAAINE